MVHKSADLFLKKKKKKKKMGRYNKSLAYARDTNGETALHVLARKPSTIANKSDLGIWKRSINTC